MASKATSDLGGGCVGDAKELPPAVAGACFFYFAVHVGCHSPLALHCMPCSGTEDAVSSPGSFLLSVVAFSANPCCSSGHCWSGSAQRGLGQSPCSMGKGPGVMSKNLKKNN